MRIVTLIPSSSMRAPPPGAPGAPRQSPDPSRSLATRPPSPEARLRARAWSNALDGVRQVPLRDREEAEAAVGHECGPARGLRRGEAERLLPMTPALGKGPELAQGPRQPGPGFDPKTTLRVPDSRSAASTFRPSSSAV